MGQRAPRAVPTPDVERVLRVGPPSYDPHHGGVRVNVSAAARPVDPQEPAGHLARLPLTSLPSEQQEGPTRHVVQPIGWVPARQRAFLLTPA